MVALALLTFILPSSAKAVEYSGETRTYLMARETLSGDHLVPLYEYLSFNIDKINDKDFSFQMSGWLRGDLADKRSDNTFGDDLSYAYFNVGLDDIKTRLKLGRVYVFEGVTAEQVDGLYAKFGPFKGVDLAVYTGSPANLYTDDREGDFIYGGRLSYTLSKYFGVGASYLKENNDGHEFREETGVDLWAHPISKVDLAGTSTYNNKTKGWMEHTYHIALGPDVRNFRVIGDFSKIDYEHYFASSTLSVFDKLNKEESYVMGGGGVEFDIIDSLTLTAKFKNYEYEVSDRAVKLGGAVSYVYNDKFTAGASIDRMDGDANDLRYIQYRAYASGKIMNFDLTADVIDVSYDKEVNKIKDAYAIVGSIGYDITKQYRVASDIEYSKSPYYDEDVIGMFKFIYKFGKG